MEIAIFPDHIFAMYVNEYIKEKERESNERRKNVSLEWENIGTLTETNRDALSGCNE